MLEKYWGRARKKLLMWEEDGILAIGHLRKSEEVIDRNLCLIISFEIIQFPNCHNFILFASQFLDLLVVLSRRFQLFSNRYYERINVVFKPPDDVRSNALNKFKSCHRKVKNSFKDLKNWTPIYEKNKSYMIIIKVYGYLLLNIGQKLFA